MQMGDKHRKYNNMYIRNFGDELDDDHLWEMFEQYGKIISAKVTHVKIVVVSVIAVLV